ncbi:MAG TPA: hypothetical protein VF463_12760 [Sphingobium sp.]
MKPALPLLSAMLALTGCAHNSARTPVREGPARLGETVSVDGPSVRPIRVIEDSRCPENARCIWAGRLVLRTVVSGGRWSRKMDLTLGQPAQIADGALTLVSALPEKSATHPTKPGDYRFAFAFQGGL